MDTLQRNVQTLTNERNIWLRRTWIVDGIDPYEVRKQRRYAYIQAERLTTALIAAFCMLPQHKPLHPCLIRVNRKLHVLQSVEGDNARYVPLRNWDATRFAYNPTTPRQRLQHEQDVRERILSQIQSLEYAGVDPTVAIGNTEVAWG